MSTIRDVAERAGVSSATVSHVINETRFVSDGLRKRVITAMEELGYRRNALARSLRKGRTQTIGLILPDSSNTFFAELGHGIEEAAFSHGYNLILCNSDNDLEKEHLYIDLLTEKQVDGIILDTEEKDICSLHARIPKTMPIVLIDRDLVNNDFDTVLSDSKQGGSIAAKHLIELGHTRIACITGHEYLASSIERLQAFKHSLDEVGLSLDPNMIAIGSFLPESGHIGALKLLRQKCPPTAIFACNDMMAIGVLRAAVELGLRVPDDLSLVGFDNIDLCNYTCPTLTTVAQDKAALGQKVIQHLIERISKNTIPEVHDLVPTNLVIRETTRAIN
jgi:LacI family transcriptional regulator